MRHACRFIAFVLPLVACASTPTRFALRPPFTLDTDLHPVSVPCHPDPTPKEPKRESCTPEFYVSPLAWDGIDNTIFDPLSRFLGVEVAGEAVNANSLDEVADSAWFTNRIGKTPVAAKDAAMGACAPEDYLAASDDVPDGTWIIDHGKDNGATPGFRIDVPGKGRYMLKADTPEQPERATAASVIGAALYHLSGFYSTCEQVVYIRRGQLKLTPGLTVTSNAGITRPFDEKALAAVLASSTQQGPLTRMQASKWLPGITLGPFRYERTRDDDPNDIIAHEDRRELRGGRLLAAWMNHFDAREQNSMDCWISADPARPRSSPGYVRHYYLDTSDCLGSEWDWDGISRRLGQSYYLDFGDVLTDFLTLGILERPWDRAERTKGREKFGYFSARDFDPSEWKAGYPNPAFSRMSERDGAWMARIIARFTDDDVRAIVVAGRFTDPADTSFLSDVMLERQRLILARYLTQLSPLTDVRREADGRLCATDLARLRGVVPAERFRYQAFERVGENLRWIAVTPEADGKVCLAPPASQAPDGGSADDAAERLVIFQIDNGTGAGPLEIHAYDLGPARGVQIVGLRRPAP